MKTFEYKEEDIDGAETLDAISSADKFNSWMYQTIKPHCKGEILEIGSGIGNISQFFLSDDYSITLSDIRQNYCDKLKNKFSQHKSCKDVKHYNIVDDHFDKEFAHEFEKYDTIFALNVVEHIKDDSLAIANCYKLLKPNGILIILVPSYQFLYNGIDKALEHYKRYNKKTLSKLFSENKLAISHKQYFNFMGIFGWYVSGKLQKNETIPEGQMKLYNLLVPVFKIIDKIIFNLIGLSTIVVGKK